MVYLDEKLPTHPKILKAGDQLGANGGALALSLYVAGLAYARANLTDGFLPDAFVRACGLVRMPQSVANALSSRGVRLWHKRRGGFQIHDWDRWNPKASEIKQKRDADRRRQAAWRAGKNGTPHTLSQRDKRVTDNRTRARAVHDPLITVRTRRDVPVDRQVQIVTGRCASGLHGKPITHRILCAMVRAERETDPRLDYPSLVELLKVRLTSQGYAYPDGRTIESAIDAVDHARRRTA